jgi:polysaccharide export outer membrane protein
MKCLWPVSRLALILIVFTTSIANAQLSVNDVAAQADMRGYSTYHQFASDDQGKTRPMMQAPQPIVNQQLYQPNTMLDNTQIVSPRDDTMVDDKPSRIEMFYRERTGDKSLNQYGYDLFYTADQKPALDRDGRAMQTTATAGAVSDDYILQAGDKINVIFSGETRKRETYDIESDGQLYIDDLGAVNAAGRSLQSIKNDIKAIAENMNYRGDISVSVAAMRQIGVLVAGQVHKPGRHQLSAFHSVLDALNMAGGIRKSGSLRNIKLIRKGQSQIIDLYDVIAFQNRGHDGALMDGDRIIIPPLGPTFAVVGDVKQSGIFELKSNFNNVRPMSLNQALKVSGGVLGGGQIRYSLTRADGVVVNMTQKSRAMITDGSILNVIRATDRLANAIEVLGYSRKNGIYDLGSAGTLHAMMGDRQIFGDDTYPLMGVIARVNRDSLTQKMMGFSPQAVALNQDDRQLEAGDKIYLFSHGDIADILKNNNDDTQKTSLSAQQNQFPKLISDFVIDSAVSVQGAVRSEGQWPVGTVTDLKTLISVAGGLTSKASRSDIEITSRNADLGNAHRRKKIDAKDMRLSNVMLEPGDQVRVNARYEQAVEKTVRVTGEVKQPGSYDLMRGDTLSSVIERAGGLTPDAYPPAAVFSRKAERKREAQKFRAAAQELERTVSVNLNAVDKDAALTPSQITMARKLADDLRSVQAVGRVTVEADPTVLSVRPEIDMLVEDGDHLHIPKRSLNVRVSGEVMNPASLLFEDRKDPNDYIREAGGKSYYADSDRMFVVYPDGSAQPLKGTGWGSNKPAMIIPGSTIIVPRDPKPFSFMDSFKDITQILTNMAITGVFIEDIATDEN